MRLLHLHSVATGGIKLEITDVEKWVGWRSREEKSGSWKEDMHITIQEIR